MATQIVAGRENSCAVFQDERIKCWGQNEFAELGGGRRGNLGTLPKNSDFVFLGRGVYVRSIDINRHACAALTDGRVKCWGDNTSGKIGLEREQAIIGSVANEIGDGLPFVDLGTNARAQSIYTGEITSMVHLSDGRIKWWGEINMRVGRESVGDDRGEMGDSNRPLNLGRPTALVLAVFRDNPCVVLDNNKVKCWGFTNSGIPGVARDTVHGNDIASHAPIDLGSLGAVDVVVGASHACALLENGIIKCWGSARSGALGRPRMAVVFGDLLPSVAF
jgi:E3 ubiquitin-protein ligase HERC3